MSKIEIGKIVNTHGLRGTIKVQPWADFPEIFEELPRVFCYNNEYEIVSVSYQKNLVLLNLKGVTTLNDAEKLKNSVLSAERDDMEELPEDTYYVTDLIGCVIFENDTEIGKISDVIATGGVDLYEIRRSGNKPLYLPASKENILNIDIEAKAIQVKIPEGLLDL